MFQLKSLSFLLAVAAGTTLYSQSPSSAEYLLPIRPYEFDEWRNTEYKLLIKDEHSILWMIVRPSWENTYCVLMKKEKSGRYQIRWSELDIDPAKPQSPSGLLRSPSDLIVKQERIAELPAVTAEYISIAWSRTLAQTRYPNAAVGGVQRVLDGVRFEFFGEPGMYGQAWMPQAGAPKLLSDLGEALIVYVKTPAATREDSLEKCREIASKLRVIKYDSKPAPNP